MNPIPRVQRAVMPKGVEHFQRWRVAAAARRVQRNAISSSTMTASTTAVVVAPLTASRIFRRWRGRRCKARVRRLEEFAKGLAAEVEVVRDAEWSVLLPGERRVYLDAVQDVLAGA